MTDVSGLALLMSSSMCPRVSGRGRSLSNSNAQAATDVIAYTQNV
jgi:hypothetical protein